MKWTAAQSRAAGLFDADVCVPAGAGSGKTAVLVERYLHAVEKKGFKPSEILAITFTDKAAAEMKRRVIDESLRRGLPGLRADLESAPIGTIHAFCIRLLRENPVECGIDPEFRILGDAERELVLARTFDALLESEFEDPRVVEVVALYDKEPLRLAFLRLLEHLRASGAAPAPEPDFAAAEKEARAALEKALKDIAAVRRDKGEWSEEEAATRAGAEKAVRALTVAAGWPRVAAVEAAIDELGARSKTLKEAVVAAREAAEAWQSAESARLSLPVRRTFLRLFTRFTAMIADEKRRLSAFDYDDFIEKALDALRGADPIQKAFAERTRARFKAIFVDEYQDVNPAQAALVEHLRTPGNRFVVGDRRQSIYGFRHADPSIFDRVRGVSETAPLSDNFRSRKDVLDFVNAFFAERFEGDAPLAAAQKYGAKTAPSLEILAVAAEGKEGGEKPLDRARVREARALAARLKEMVDSKFTVEPKNEPPRPVEWRDIAVLFRKSTAIRLYDKAFRDAGIPFDLPKGKGFFEKNEITDLLSFLTVLDDPLEDIPLAAVLRSPLVRLSDDALFLIAQQHTEKNALIDALAAEVRLPAEDRARVDAFLERFARLRAARERLGISRLMETVMEETGYRPAAVLAAGPQASANIDKLIDLARETESAGGGVGDFVRLTRVLADREEDEPEAKMPAERGNAVSFLTVHAAKGLEFPIVAVADLGAEPTKNSPFVLASSAGEIGLKFKSPDGWDWIADPVYRRLQEEAAGRAVTESERLLYVAMTRAREHLILSGAYKPAKKSQGEGEQEQSWMRTVLETLGAVEGPPGPAEWKGIPYLRLPADTPPPAKAPNAGLPPFQAPADLAERLRVPAKPYEMAEDVTVTRLVEAATKDELEALKALWAEEPDKDGPTRDEEDDEPTVPANRFGTVFHKLMELSMRPSLLAPLAAGDFDAWTREFGETEKENLKRQSETFWKGEWGKIIRGAKKRYPELPFIFKTPHGLLKGQIDLVFQGADGRWVILDYKTNRIAKEEVAATAKRYEFQLALYAYVFAELTGEMPARGVLYFSSIGETAEFAYGEGFGEGVRDKLEQAHAQLIFPGAFAKISNVPTR